MYWLKVIAVEKVLQLHLQLLSPVSCKNIARLIRIWKTFRGNFIDRLERPYKKGKPCSSCKRHCGKIRQKRLVFLFFYVDIIAHIFQTFILVRLRRPVHQQLPSGGHLEQLPGAGEGHGAQDVREQVLPPPLQSDLLMQKRYLLR